MGSSGTRGVGRPVTNALSSTPLIIRMKLSLTQSCVTSQRVRLDTCRMASKGEMHVSVCRSDLENLHCSFGTGSPCPAPAQALSAQALPPTWSSVSIVRQAWPPM